MVASERRTTRWSAHAAGATVSIVFHLLLSAPMILGFAAHKTRSPPHDGPGSVSWSSRGEQSQSMVLLDLSGLTASTPNEEFDLQIDAEGIEFDEQTRALASWDPKPPPAIEIDAKEAEVSNEAVGDPQTNAALFGRYMGQIAARIERSWMRPRTAVAGGRFDCRVRITQDRTGQGAFDRVARV
jgi:hypothetical protein